MANAVAQATLGLPAGVEGRDARTALAGTPGLADVAGRALRGPTGDAPELVQVGEGATARALVVQWAPVPGDSAGGVILSLADAPQGRPAAGGDRGPAMLTGIGRLTSHMAHELKNPLGALKLYALLLSRQLREGQGQASELAEKIARAVDSLSTE